jgi:hypothetical protein
MVKKKEIADAMTLDELRRQSQVYDPPIEVMLERFGFADQIGVNATGGVAISVEVASEFLGAYEASKTSRARKRSAYEAFLRERKMDIARAAIDARQEAEVQRQANNVVDEDAPSFEDWETQNGV